MQIGNLITFSQTHRLILLIGVKTLLRTGTHIGNTGIPRAKTPILRGSNTSSVTCPPTDVQLHFCRMEH